MKDPETCAENSRRRSFRAARPGFHFRHVYVFENNGNGGVHTHILASVPVNLIPSFEKESVSILSNITGQEATKETVVVQSAKGEVKVQWIWFRYVCKNMELETIGHKLYGRPGEPGFEIF
jgi:hypothetical protein